MCLFFRGLRLFFYLSGLLHRGHWLLERDLRLDREGGHQGGENPGHEVGRGVPGEERAAQVDEGKQKKTL